MSHKKLPILNCFCLALLLLGVNFAPCAGQPGVVWQPSFETDGIDSDIAETLSKRKRWGFIDNYGSFKILPKYDLVKAFKNGTTIVGVDERYFKIDKTGKAVSPDMTRVEVINETNKKRWAAEGKEKEESAKAKYSGNIFDASGTKLFGPSSDFELGIFAEGLASCTVKPKAEKDYSGLGMNRTGYIDKNGRLVISPKYQSGEPFQGGLAKVDCVAPIGQGSDYVSGYINRSGQLLGEHTYKTAWDFSNGLAIVETIGKTEGDTEWGFIDKSGKELMGHWTEVANYSGKIAGVRDRNGLWGFVDRQGKLISPYQFLFVGHDFTNHLNFVKTKDGFGYVDEKGHWIIAPKFADADEFSEGLAPAAVAVSEDEIVTKLASLQKWRCSFLDPTGKAIASGFYAARHFSEGLAAVRTGTKWGYINEKGELAIHATFDKALDFSQGLAAVLIGERWGFIDKKGNFKIQPTFLARDFANDSQTVPQKFSEGVSIAPSPDYFWRFIGTDGKQVFHLESRMIANLKPIVEGFSEGLAVLKDDTNYHYGYIDHQGKYKIPPKLEEAASFSEGYAAVGVVSSKIPLIDVERFELSKWSSDQPKPKFGFIDRTGKFVVQPRYDKVGSFHEGLAAVGCGEHVKNMDGEPGSIRISRTFPDTEMQAKWGFIDCTGKEIIDLKYSAARDFSEGLAPVKSGTKWGFIDKQGKFAIRPQFEFAAPFSNGLSAVSIDGKYGFIDNKGTQIIEPRYSLAGSFSNGRALVITANDTSAKISTEGRIFSTPVKTNDDILKFLLELGNPPDEGQWAGYRH
ncbi:MAG: WG repeat-containing protein [Candidatus Obscuribacterales bacterium]